MKFDKILITEHEKYYTYKELAKKFNFPIIEGQTKKAINARERQIEELRTYYNIGSKNPKNGKYLLKPHGSKRELKRKVKEAQGEIIVLEDKNINLTSTRKFTQTGIRDLYLHYLINYYVFNRNRFIIMCFYQTRLFDLFKKPFHHPETREKDYILYKALQLIMEKIENSVDKSIKTFKDKGIISVTNFYHIKETYYTVDESFMEECIQQALEDVNTKFNIHLTKEDEALRRKPSIRQYYLKRRDKKFNAAIEWGQMPAIIETNKNNESDYSIAYKDWHVRLLDESKRLFLTQEEISTILKNFITVVRESLCYDILNRPDRILAKEFFHEDEYRPAKYRQGINNNLILQDILAPINFYLQINENNPMDIDTFLQEKHYKNYNFKNYMSRLENFLNPKDWKKWEEDF